MRSSVRLQQQFVKLVLADLGSQAANPFIERTSERLRLLFVPLMSNVSYGFFLSEGRTNPVQLQCSFENRCRTGNAAEHLVATREGCATVPHADMRGLATSRQMCVAGLPPL